MKLKTTLTELDALDDLAKFRRESLEEMKIRERRHKTKSVVHRFALIRDARTAHVWRASLIRLCEESGKMVAVEEVRRILNGE